MTSDDCAGETEAGDTCPVCEAPYDSLSVHEGGLMVNLLDNDRYRRVCFDPAEHDGVPAVEFYHHTHDQVAVSDLDESDEGGDSESDRAGIDSEARRGDPVDSGDAD